MKEWLFLSLLLCTFGFFKEIQPSEPFMTDFLAGPWRNLTHEQINKDVYPVGTYSYTAQLIVVFLVTDLFRYKPLIVTTGLSGMIVWSCLLWTTSLEALQALEFFYGTYMASEVAYYTYIYAKVDKSHYAAVSGHTRAATLMGKFLASVLSQILVFYVILDYKQLNYITLLAQICATIIALFLPAVKTSLYFNRGSGVEESNTEEHTLAEAFKLIWTHFRHAYTKIEVVKWSCWYALATCGHLQVSTYVQVLWRVINTENHKIWNGAVDAILTLFGAGFALLAGYIHVDRLNPSGSILLIAALSIMQGLFVMLESWTTVIYASYAGHILFTVMYNFAITVASAEVARHLDEDSFGLVFGVNTFIGLVCQTILTLVVVKSDLYLDIVQQYTVYSSFFIVIGIIYFICFVFEIVWHKRRTKEEI